MLECAGLADCRVVNLLSEVRSTWFLAATWAISCFLRIGQRRQILRLYKINHAAHPHRLVVPGVHGHDWMATAPRWGRPDTPDRVALYALAVCSDTG